jgi:class 3 adenylate cyclase
MKTSEPRTPLRALLVEDSEDDAELVVIALRQAGYDISFERVQSAGAMHAALEEHEWDVVICDYNLPGFSGTAALRLLQESQLDLPFLLVSGTVPEDTAVAAMKSGARDYVMKDNLARLAPALERELQEASTRREQKLHEEERHRLESLMSLYLHPEVASMVAGSPALLSLGGEKRECTVLFADLRGFTSAAEALEAEVLVEVLSEYLEAMTDIVFENGGLLDKYMGDGIMALWGAPLPLEDHAWLACRAALQMVDKQRELVGSWKDRGLPPLQVGVGINTGPMVVGNLGSSRRFTYTALGDHVNLGSRVEQLNKIYGTHVLITENTFEQLDGGFNTRPIDLVRVKGKQTAVQVYELISSGSGDGENWFRAEFEEALAAYRGRHWEDAFRRFTAIASRAPEDGPTRLYVERCLTMLNRPPSAEWDGAYIAEPL